MNRFRIPGIGSIAGRLLWVAGVLGVVALLIAVATMPRLGFWIHPWARLPAAERLAASALLVSVLAVFATILILAAAVVQIQQSFPRQRLTFRAQIHNNQTWLEACNPEDGPIINAYRIDAALVGADKRSRSSGRLTNPGFQVLDPRASLGSWSRYRSTNALFFNVLAPNPTHGWTVGNREQAAWHLQGQEPWFPGVFTQTPSVPIDWLARPVAQRLEWKVTWWTDRGKPERHRIPVNA